MNQIAPAILRERLEQVQQRIEAACRAAGRRPDELRLVAVGKGHPAAAIRQLHALGLRDFGESYVDEGTAKIEALADCDIEWHHVGPIQSNKTRAIAAHFDWAQSVDRARIVRRLGDQRAQALAPLEVLIQVNLDAEAQKSGCRPDQIEELAGQIAQSPRLTLRGLMAIPAARQDHDDQRTAFARLRELFEQLRSEHPEIDTISAGMSADFEAAIAEGATMIRIGTALFGPRN